MKSIFALAGFLLIALLEPATASAANEQAFIDLFGGSWVGTAKLLTSSFPVQANCQATGQPAANRITISGDCRVAIVNVRIGADITYDPKSGTYEGSYIGANVGPARVFGKRIGNIVNLNITWPKPVRGDTHARMTIENAGSGDLRMTIFDNLTPGGPESKTSDAMLKTG